MFEGEAYSIKLPCLILHCMSLDESQDTHPVSKNSA